MITSRALKLLWTSNTPKKLPVAPLPIHLQKVVRAHQRAGINWLYNRKSGVILADDMGLGKTLQILAFISCMRFAKPVLLVAPPSLLGNWQRESEKWTPNIRASIYNPKNPFSKADLILISYDVMMREQEALAHKDFALVIFDEAQALKNPATKRSRAARALTAPKIAMTGTPIENSLKDLFALIDLVRPGLLGKDIKEFEKIYNANPKALQKKIEPYVLHRKKSDLPELGLPSKKEMLVKCVLSAKQKELYAHAIQDLPDSPQGALALLQHLKQLCDDPSLIGTPSASGKLAWLKSQMNDWDSPFLVFSQYRRMLDRLEKVSKDSGWEIYRLDGSMSRKKREAMLARWAKSTNPKRVFLISLRAGGCGLTLTEAARVVHFDRWWNPAVEEQATDRTYRIGQMENVEVYKLITRGTLEEKIDRLLLDKKALQQLLHSGDRQALQNLVALAA